MSRQTLSSLIILCVILSISACTPSSKTGAGVPVEWKGALKNMMRKGDISAQVNLQHFQKTEHLYALGAVAELKGEILVLDGLPLIASVQDQAIIVDTTYDSDATLLVYTSVEDWVSTSIAAKTMNKEALEQQLELVAESNGLNLDRPFPFLLRGLVNTADWHVINWPKGDKEHTHEKHISSGLSGTIKDEEVEILGFYSKHHHAIFTHHTTNMHMHVRTLDNSIVGHLDDLILARGVELLLPQITTKAE